MQTLSFQAPAEMSQKLEQFAKSLDRSKAWLIRQALEDYFEDLQDYVDAKAYKANYDPRKNVSLEAVKARYGLDG